MANRTIFRDFHATSSSPHHRGPASTSTATRLPATMISPATSSVPMLTASKPMLSVSAPQPTTASGPKMTASAPVLSTSGPLKQSRRCVRNSSCGRWACRDGPPSERQPTADSPAVCTGRDDDVDVPAPSTDHAATANHTGIGGIGGRDEPVRLYRFCTCAATSRTAAVAAAINTARQHRPYRSLPNSRFFAG